MASHCQMHGPFNTRRRLRVFLRVFFSSWAIHMHILYSVVFVTCLCRENKISNSVLRGSSSHRSSVHTNVSLQYFLSRDPENKAIEHTKHCVRVDVFWSFFRRKKNPPGRPPPSVCTVYVLYIIYPSGNTGPVQDVGIMAQWEGLGKPKGAPNRVRHEDVSAWPETAQKLTAGTACHMRCDLLVQRGIAEALPPPKKKALSVLVHMEA